MLALLPIRFEGLAGPVLLEPELPAVLLLLFVTPNCVKVALGLVLGLKGPGTGLMPAVS